MEVVIKARSADRISSDFTNILDYFENGDPACFLQLILGQN